jgi:hypothetical protein
MITFNFIKPFGEKHMKKFIFIILLGLFGQAHASGFDALAPWTEDTSGGGTINFIDNTSVDITGCSFFIFGCTAVTSITASAPTNGTVAFDWSLTDLAGYSFVVFLQNALGERLINSLDPLCAAGSCSFDVGNGDLFGIALQDTTGAGGFGAAVAHITNFDWAPSGQGGVGAVPLPPAFLLFGVALAGLGFVQKRKQQAAV